MKQAEQVNSKREITQLWWQLPLENLIAALLFGAFEFPVGS